jgi:hypothetical protein
MLETEITQLARNPYSLGIIARYLFLHRPHAQFQFRSLLNALMFLIDEGTLLMATRDDATVGHLGWLRVTPECAN